MVATPPAKMVGGAVRRNFSPPADVGLLEDNTDCDKGDDCQSGLDDHCAVADDLCVLLRVELLGGGTGTDERVEAGDARRQTVMNRVGRGLRCR